MILRKHFNTKLEDVVIARELSLEEAKEHCADSNTSWNTCSAPDMLAYTEKHGKWFDAFTEE
jgi:hypothetical protein